MSGDALTEYDVGKWFERAKLKESDRAAAAAVTVTRRLCFCAGHRVFGHESKCAHPHGHNYVVHLTATAAALDKVGRVIDFGVIKELAGGWIDSHWDHAFLYFADDPDMAEWFGRGHYRAFCCSFNPTAENMAHYLLHTVAPSLFRGSGVTVVEVQLEETENCRATVRL